MICNDVVVVVDDTHLSSHINEQGSGGRSHDTWLTDGSILLNFRFRLPCPLQIAYTCYLISMN